ncbi:hypothetical protein PACTADRAFT_48695 [Pachysolen tannophilus NRRL Y-2460]|uniref:tRNA(Ile)-lysidine synthetase n=1 Tax=Pachysolen tannophilus NRRL Y-2460 TaxID=669874 RepID=A0A1E4TYR6_PACTA|nr:hypothetical protein PACTADRAFT_48695 [Pachysolen tannophilus NRRL Y-2460]
MASKALLASQVQSSFNSHVSKFFGALAQVVDSKSAVPAKLGVALSGGVDSVSLTFLLKNYLRQTKQRDSYKIVAITIDHQYRKESSKEACQIGHFLENHDYHQYGNGIGRCCGEVQGSGPKSLHESAPGNLLDSGLGSKQLLTVAGMKKTFKSDGSLCSSSSSDKAVVVEHKILKIDWSSSPLFPHIPNFEEVSRAKRYELLHEYCLSNGIKYLFVGHTKDDAVETFLLRLHNNSTIFGLVGGLRFKSLLPLPPKSPHDQIHVVRPLLKTSKSELYNYCKENNLLWFEDYTNTDYQLTLRNKLRYLLSQKLISCEKILELLNSVTDLLAKVNIRIHNLETKLINNGCLRFDKSYLEYEISLDEHELDFDTKEYDKLIIDRFFYKLCYKISPLKNYHYMFTKLHNKENSIYDKILASSKKSNSITKFTVLGLQWKISTDVRGNSKFFKVHIKRQAPLRYESPEVLIEVPEKHHTDWILFDNTCFLRFKQHENASIKSLKLRLFNYKQDLHLLYDKEKFKLIDLDDLQKLDNLPMVMISSKKDPTDFKFYGFPTTGKFASSESLLDIQWDLKNNNNTF